MGRVHDVVANPDGIETESFCANDAIKKTGGVELGPEMGKEQTESHNLPRVQVVRPTEAPVRVIENGRGTNQSIPLPDSRIGMDMHVISLSADGPDGAFHYHSTSENVYYVVGGAIRLRLRDGDVVLSAGDAAWIPPAVPHGVSIAGDGDARLVEIYWPAPADFVVVPES